MAEPATLTPPVVEPVANAAPITPPAAPAPVEPAAPEAKVETPKPIEYKLTAPEGFDPSGLAGVTEFAKKNNLSNEQAQAVLNQQHESRQEQVNAYRQQVEGWRASVQADKEIGGANLSRSVETARKLIDRYATPEFGKMLEDTGFGNHPEVVRFLTRIGAREAEDSMLSGRTTAQEKPFNAAEMYSKSNMK